MKRSPSVNQTELALFCLRFLDPDSHYDEWLKIGAALYSVDSGLENEFDKWSSGGSKYKDSKEIATKWRSFSGGTKANIGVLTPESLRNLAQNLIVPNQKRAKKNGGDDICITLNSFLKIID